MKSFFGTTSIARNCRVTLTVALAVATLTGCSNAEDDVYAGLRCARVASILNQPQKVRAVAAKIEKRFMDLPDKYKNNKSQFFMMLNERFTDDLGLYKLSPQGQASAITDVYESGKCQKLYQ